MSSTRLPTIWSKAASAWLNVWTPLDSSSASARERPAVWSRLMSVAATHLRHHGFPSPLLDWSRSPYVAAFFAFRRPERDAEFVSIFLYDERPANVKSSDSRDPIIHRFGPNVRTHRRHFLQQSEYTVAARFNKEWEFSPHKAVCDLNIENQDVLTKFDISVSERNKVIMRLDSANLNASSLFGSEDSLMETLATRRFG
jgi:hypothetical protein